MQELLLTSAFFALNVYNIDVTAGIGQTSQIVMVYSAPYANKLEVRACQMTDFSAPGSCLEMRH